MGTMVNYESTSKLIILLLRKSIDFTLSMKSEEFLICEDEKVPTNWDNLFARNIFTVIG